MVKNNLNKNNIGNERLFTTSSFVIAIKILFVVFIGIYIYQTYKEFQKKKKSQIDISIPECPDYWDKIGSKKCKNNLRVNGRCNTTVDNSIMDFDNEIFNNQKFGNKFKCKWARDCGVSWSGISSLC